MERLGRLSDSTLANYRTRLKKLWRIYPHITDEKQKDLCMKEMLRLSDKTGLELGGPTLSAGFGRGRPRERYELTKEDRELLQREEIATTIESKVAETSEERLQRIAKLLGKTVEEVNAENKLKQEESARNKETLEKMQIAKDEKERQERNERTGRTT